jgi:RNA polymerase sigma-70 factor (ECF subfamily)
MSQPMSQPIPEPPSDAELMVRVREGDREAFAELVERHKDAVVSYLARLTADPDRAEDLGQETFFRLFRAAGAYREQGYLRAYLLRIGTNLVRSEERRARRRRLMAPFLVRETGEAREGREDSVEPAAVTGLLRRELHREVTAAVARLPLRYRVALVLHEIEGWTYLDIARELGCREGTVKSRVHRGRLQLKKRLEPYWTGNGNGETAWKNNGKNNG